MDNSNNNRSEVYSTKIRAGKRTYFFDVKETRSQDYYITITESKRRFGGEGYDKHKIFLYKEDFNKFMNCLSETIDHVKTNLLPDYDYEEFDRDPIMLNDGEDNHNNGNSGESRNMGMAAEPGFDGNKDSSYSESDSGDEVGTTWED